MIASDRELVAPTLARQVERGEGHGAIRDLVRKDWKAGRESLRIPVMEQRDLGRTGLRVSALGFGAGNIGGLMVRGDPADQRRAVARAIEAGITYFDTAPQYGDGRSEENLGRALRDVGAWGRVVVGTKVRLTAEGRRDPAAAIRASVETSLRRLGRDAVDLIQLHNPIGADGDAGSRVGADEAAGAIAEGLRSVVEAGLVAHFGLTGLGETEAVHAVATSGPGFETVQAYFNPVNPSAGHAGRTGGGQDFAGLIDAVATAGLGVIAIRVVAAGALTGTPDRPAIAGNPSTPLTAGGEYHRDLDRARRLAPIAAQAGLAGPIELALRFVLSKPGVSTALVGYSDQGQLEAAIRWAERGPLPPDLIARVLDVAD